MPLINLYLFSLSGPLARFLSSLRVGIDAKHVIAISRPRYLYIPSAELDARQINETRWDILLLLHSDATIPTECQPMISHEYSLRVGIPSSLLSAYAQHNAQLLREASGIPLTGALEKAVNGPGATAKISGDNLELSKGLLRFMGQMEADGEGDRPVSMLNLLRFREDGRDSYLKYGQGFKEAGGRRGGDAKIVGTVVDGDSRSVDKWDEIAFVHYPSIRHFCDMTAGEDYQKINQKYRLKGLRDTVLLCTTEIDLLGQRVSSKM